jgi:predicted flap endonuclease-1-like 5' DNA nuclease
MNFETLFPYLLAGAGFLVGVALGWLLRGLRSRPRLSAEDKLDARIQALQALADNKRQSIRQAEAMIAQMDMYLSTLNRDIANARQQLQQRDHEHTNLLMTLDERRALVEDAQSDLHRIRENLESREQEADVLLSNINKRIEELDMLKDVQESYFVKINRLTQQVQWQDSELRMLQQTIRTKTAEINEARALLTQRDAELRRVIRQRDQRDIDITHAYQILRQRDEELRRLLNSQPLDDAPDDRPSRSRSAEMNRLDVTPEKTSPLLPGPAISLSESNEDDDLTELPGLADLYAKQLREQGIRTFRQVALATPEQIQGILRIPGHFSPDIAAWIEAARERISTR